MWNDNVKKLPLNTLQGQFFIQDLMDALEVVYPQYWLQLERGKKVKCSFGNHQDNLLLA
jgi:SpoU rRNA methylase family enzyme